MTYLKDFSDLISSLHTVFIDMRQIDDIILLPKRIEYSKIQIGQVVEKKEFCHTAKFEFAMKKP